MKPWVWLLILLALVALAACALSPRSLLRPNGVVQAQDGTLYVMDRGNYRIVHLDVNGKVLGSFGKFGTRPEQIHSGWDLAQDAQGNLYIGHVVYSEESEVVQDGVKVFSPRGKLVAQIGTRDYAYGESTARPYGLDVDEAGRIYVADFAANALRVFAPTGELLARFPAGPETALGEFQALNDVAIDDTRGILYAVDNLLAEVRAYRLQFDAQGVPSLTLLRTWGEYGHEAGAFSYPQYLAVDEVTGQVYVSDMGNQQIQVFSHDGLYVKALVPPQRPWQAMGLTVGREGTVFVADAFNNVIWAFATDGAVMKIEVTP